MFPCAAQGAVHALDISTGKSPPGWPLKNLYDPALLHNYGGLNLADDGMLYITVASMCDNGR